MKRQLYLDLDGVLFDFDGHYFELFGKKSQEEPDDVLWSNVKKHGTFFQDLPLFEGAIDFFYTLSHLFPVTILTACPKTDYRSAAIQKRKAVYEKIGSHVRVIPMLGGVNKALFMHSPGDILVDDFEKNIRSWNELGGIGILHKNYSETQEQVYKLRISENGT